MKFLSILTALLLFCFLGYSQNNSYKRYKPCSFSVELPAHMKLQKMYTDPGCDYEVKLKDGAIVMELHSLSSGRFEYNTISELYNAAIHSSKLKITYKSLHTNYFVISGIDKANGNVVYWKRVLGRNFISDMHIEYNKNKSAAVEPFIGRISKSFTSD